MMRYLSTLTYQTGVPVVVGSERASLSREMDRPTVGLTRHRSVQNERDAENEDPGPGAVTDSHRRLSLAVACAVPALLATAGCGGSSGTDVETVIAKGPKTYRQVASSMEPTIHCAMPAPGCEASQSDVVLAEPVDPSGLKRGDIVVFEAPAVAEERCGAGGTFVKRIIGLPGEAVEMRFRRGASFVYVDGQGLDEPYIEDDRRGVGPIESFLVPPDHYFLMGDNRSQSCDSRIYGAVPKESISRRVTKIIREG